MRERARPLGFGVGLILMCVCTSVSANIIVYSETNQIEAEYRDMPARFGAMVNPEGIQAMLVYAEPAYGCSPLPKPPTPVINESIHWAILISRNNCTFYEKVKNAQDAEYHIAIVHNVGSDELEPMSENEKQGEPISIIAVFVGERAGHHLRERYLYNNSYFIEVNNDYPFIIDNLLLPFAIVVGLCFFLMLGFMVGMVVKCIRDRKRARRLRLPYSSLKQIPSSKFHKGDPYETCAICLEDYVEGDKLRILPCSHAYHTKCIDPWLTRKRRVCPVCKRKVFAANEVPPHPSSLSDSEDTDSDDTTPLIRSQQPAAGLNWGTFAATTNQQVNPLMTSVALDISTASSSTSSPQSSSSSNNERDRVEEETGVRRFRRDLVEEDDRRARRLRAAKCDELSSSQPDVEREREEGREREREEASASGQRRQHGHNIQGTSISLPINASLEDHQEVPSTVIAGVSGQGEDDQQPNTSAIKKLWQSWSR
ncbi:hypothetical protein LSTR_LSTR012599 [Laodelphax striatellus]|uniref:RING-type domain-containing protein n=1 Tax=Laodelphax striatellus TaxID=195883 RepID=A0A482X3V1_LAOST|nr:hypothetical protein LSTR_LSTR012599 [Laodelphax striatellus]